MTRNLGTTFAIALLGSAAAFAGPFTGPVSNYYLSNGSTMFQVQGLTLINSWSMDGLPAAVDTTIRTNGSGAFGSTGAQYDLSGNPLGPTYTNTTGAQIFDGTT